MFKFLFKKKENKRTVYLSKDIYPEEFNSFVEKSLENLRTIYNLKTIFGAEEEFLKVDEIDEDIDKTNLIGYWCPHYTITPLYFSEDVYNLEYKFEDETYAKILFENHKEYKMTLDSNVEMILIDAYFVKKDKGYVILHTENSEKISLKIPVYHDSGGYSDIFDNCKKGNRLTFLIVYEKNPVNGGCYTVYTMNLILPW